MLEDVDLFAGFFIACEREDGLPRLRLWSFAGDGPEATPAAEIEFPEPAYSAHPHINRIFETTTFRYGYQSLVTPARSTSTTCNRRVRAAETARSARRIRSYPLRQRARSCHGRRWQAGSYLHRLPPGQVSSRAGIPLYVYGYGSYGYSLPLGFSSNRLSLLDRGVVMAYAHIRGGGDLGKPGTMPARC